MRACRSISRAHFLRPVLALAVAAFVLFPLRAQTVTQPVDTASKSGIKIQASSLYGGVPVRGYLPVRVAIDNASGEDGVWTISTNSGQYYQAAYTTSTQLRVPAHSHDTFEVLAPLDFAGQLYDRAVNVEINGPGVNNPRISWDGRYNFYGGSSSTMVVFGLSPALTTAQGSKLDDYYKKSSQSTLRANLDPDLMSPDWRSYIGFDFMVFSAADWLNQSATVRAAVLQWVATGGDLRIVADQDGGLSLPPRQGEHYGAGAILLFTPDDLANYDFSKVHPKPDQRFLFNFNYVPPDWLGDPASAAGTDGKPVAATPAPSVATFASAAPAIKNKYYLVMLVIVAFGIFVGPVNLFVFCRGANRSRLLWVTPLLSLAASGILLVYIFASEGLGGHGIYYRLTQLAPDGKFAVESQVNASLTGVLLNHEFHLADPAWIQLSDQQRFSNGSNKSYAQFDTRYWGDWYGSRQVQTLEAVAVAPTRAAVRLEPGSGAADGAQPPSLRSEYNGQLDDLYFIDAVGRPWKTAHLANGQSVKLEPSTLDELSAAWQANLVSAPEQLHATLGKLSPLPGTFFALGDDSDTPLQPALSGMSWTSFRHVVTGPVAN